MKWANGFVNGHSLRPELNCIFSVQVCLGEVIYIAVELALNNFLVSDHAGLYLWEGLGFNPLQSRNSRPLAAPVIPTKVFRGLTETWETRRALGVHRRTACQKAQSLHPRCSTCTLTTYQSLSHCVADLPMQVICCAMQAKSFAELECVLTADIARITRYCQQWRLKPIVSKTVASTFHLQNTRAAHELTVLMNGQRLKHDFTSVYLGVTSTVACSTKLICLKQLESWRPETTGSRSWLVQHGALEPIPSVQQPWPCAIPWRNTAVSHRCRTCRRQLAELTGI